MEGRKRYFTKIPQQMDVFGVQESYSGQLASWNDSNRRFSVNENLRSIRVARCERQASKQWNEVAERFPLSKHFILTWWLKSAPQKQ